MDLRGRPRELVAHSPTAVNVGTLLSGTVPAQVVMLATTPLVSRLYTPAELGSFAALMAIPQTVAVVAGLRCDMAVVPPERDEDARRLVLAVATVSSPETSLLASVFATRIAHWMQHPELAGWMARTGVIVWATALPTPQAVLVHAPGPPRRDLHHRIQQSASVEGLRIVSARAGHGGVGGQPFGQVVGRVVAAATLMRRGRDCRLGSSAGTAPTPALLARHPRMPELNGLSALVDAVRADGVVPLIGIESTAALQDQFSRVWLLLQAPPVLINGAVCQVLVQRFATTPRGGMEALVRRSVRLSLLAGLVPSVLLALVAPVLLPWYLGSPWAKSGPIARALAPWLHLNLVTTPISTDFVVTDHLAPVLAFAVVYAATPGRHRPAGAGLLESGRDDVGGLGRHGGPPGGTRGTDGVGRSALGRGGGGMRIAPDERP